MSSHLKTRNICFLVTDDFKKKTYYIKLNIFEISKHWRLYWLQTGTQEGNERKSVKNNFLSLYRKMEELAYINWTSANKLNLIVVELLKEFLKLQQMMSEADLLVRWIKFPQTSPERICTVRPCSPAIIHCCSAALWWDFTCYCDGFR